MAIIKKILDREQLPPEISACLSDEKQYLMISSASKDKKKIERVLQVKNKIFNQKVKSIFVSEKSKRVIGAWYHNGDNVPLDQFTREIVEIADELNASRLYEFNKNTQLLVI